MTGPVPPDTARQVRVLHNLGIPALTIAALTGCPVALVPTVAAVDDDTAEQTRADLALVALVDSARLAAMGEPDDSEVEEVAEWLAEQSDHPRYCQVKDGWRKLLTSTADVEVAYAAAVKRLGSLPGLRASQHGDSLRAARDLLLKAAKAAEAITAAQEGS